MHYIEKSRENNKIAGKDKQYSNTFSGEAVILVIGHKTNIKFLYNVGWSPVWYEIMSGIYCLRKAHTRKFRIPSVAFYDPLSLQVRIVDCIQRISAESGSEVNNVFAPKYIKLHQISTPGSCSHLTTELCMKILFFLMQRNKLKGLKVAHWFCDCYLLRLLRSHHQELLRPFRPLECRVLHSGSMKPIQEPIIQ